MLQEIVDALKKYLKVGKLWENDEKARIEEENEMKKTMDTAKTATDILHDVLKTTLDTINPKDKRDEIDQKDIYNKETMKQIKDLID